MRFLLLMAVTAAVAWPAVAGKNDLLRLLPDEKIFLGWRPRPDTLAYGGGPRLSDIYAGSAPYYKNKGVVEALQLTYERGRGLIVITINGFDAKENARAMFDSWKGQAERRKVLQPLPLRDGAGVTPEQGGAIGFLLSGTSLVRTQITTNESGASEQLAKALTVISRLAGVTNPTGTERR